MASTRTRLTWIPRRDSRALRIPLAQPRRHADASPKALTALIQSQQPVVAIDLGGTKALAGVVDADGTVRSRVWLPSRDLSGKPAELLDRLAEGAAAAADQAGLS